MKFSLILRCLALAATITSMSGCSVYMAANQPEKKDISLFKRGTPKSVLLGEFGYPVAQTEHDGHKWDIWRFTQGYSGGAKAGRAAGHATMDVLTLGIWEVIGTPVESSADGRTMAYEVSYDTSNNVDQVISLKK